MAESWAGCPGNRAADLKQRIWERCVALEITAENKDPEWLGLIDRELTELGQLAGENWGHILPKEPTRYERCPHADPASGSEDVARHELGEAARHYSHEYSKAPEQSGFRQWSDACERLETAAVEYAKSLNESTDT